MLIVLTITHASCRHTLSLSTGANSQSQQLTLTFSDTSALVSLEVPQPLPVAQPNTEISDDQKYNFYLREQIALIERVWVRDGLAPEERAKRRQQLLQEIGRSTGHYVDDYQF
jgi:hypothetical protein